MPLAPGMKEKLIHREETDVPNRKANEYNIRQYVLRHFNDVEEILWILDTLPERQIKKLFKDEDIYRFLEITEKALVYLDFMPIRRYEDGSLFAEKGLMGAPENGSPRVFSTSRPANDQDIQRYTTLQKHIARLETFVRPRPGVIYNDLDRVYFRDLIKEVKRSGYEPAETHETEGVQYIPRLTTEQRCFREQQRVLAGIGFDVNSPEDIERLKEKNRLARLREEQELAALGVPSEDELIKKLQRGVT